MYIYVFLLCYNIGHTIHKHITKFREIFCYNSEVVIIYVRETEEEKLSNLYTENVFTTFTISMVQSVLKQIITMLESSICTSSAEKGGWALYIYIYVYIHFVVIVLCLLL